MFNLKSVTIGVFLLFSLFSTQSALAAKEVPIEDWLILCSNENNDNCMMTQTIVNPEDGEETDILGLAIGFFPQRTNASLAINLPPQLDPTQNVTLVIGNSETGKTFKVNQCDNMKCSAVKDLSDDLLLKMKRANSGSFAFKIKDGTNVKIHFSLKGFNDAYRYIAKKN